MMKLLFALLFSQAIYALQFTGDAKADFQNLRADEPIVVTVLDPSTGPDVGVPRQISGGEDIISGWDIEQLFFQYDPNNNEINVGIDCFVICGDADGRLGPDITSPQLASIGGEDTADLSGSESFALSLAMKEDRELQYVLGVPGGNPTLGAPLNCGEFSMRGCFGLYVIENIPGVAPAFRFLEPVRFSGVTVVNRNARPSAGSPDLEFTVTGVRQLKDASGAPFEVSPAEPWRFYVNMFAGSFVDSGVGEEYIPDQFGVIEVPFPCLLFDDCDVCLGDGSSCPDCAGVPNGPNEYDVCDVCGGDGDTCLDCLGEPNGPNDYDICDICAGDGTSCLDCLKVPGGTAQYDVCDVCDGDGTTCLDCKGVAGGRAEYDECDVCGGNGQSCKPPPVIITYFGDIVEDVKPRHQSYKGFNDYPMPVKYNPW